MSFAFALLYRKQLYSGVAEPSGTIRIGSHKKDDIYIESMLSSQITIRATATSVAVNTRPPFLLRNAEVALNRIILLSNTDRAALFVSQHIPVSKKKLRLPYNCVVRIGRKSSNDIAIRLPFVSGKHCVIRSEDGNVRIEDCGSTNGIYLNGKRVTAAKLKSGDVVSVLTLNIRLLNRELLFENADEEITIRFDSGSSAPDAAVKAADIEGRLKYKRSPRTREALPSEDIVLAAPPAKGIKYEKNRASFVSMMGTGAVMVSGFAMSAASPALLAAKAASAITPVSNMVASVTGSKKKRKKYEEQERRRAAVYTAYINDQKAKIEEVASVQRNVITRENPSVEECARQVMSLNRSLWCRMPSDSDFLDIRIGMSYEPLCIKVKGRTDPDGFQTESDEFKELYERIIEETRIVDNIPKRLSLLKNSTIGIVGERSKAICLTKNLLVELTAAHCCEDVKIIGIFDEAEKDIWDSIRWFPHIWDKDKQFRFLAYNREDSKNLCELFNDILKKRYEDISSENHMRSAHPIPHYVFLFGSKSLIEKDKIMTNLFHHLDEMGITSLFLFNDMYSLPLDCRFIIDVDKDPNGYERDKVNKRFFFTFDKPLSGKEFDEYARFMSAVELDGFAASEPLPNGITFLQGYGCKTVKELAVLDNWKNSTAYKSLAAPIGVLAGGRPFLLDIHEKAHGPHGLVAGTTGSGKSELLQSWILSMAINYHPHEVNFVLIDYKGGGMANLLEPLPHVVGKVTNISSNITRSLVSLQSELARRQHIFDVYGINHIDKYQALYRSGKADSPLPHLIIVADEFAELKKAEPDFMAGLVSASRVGRSLGVHLVLATQKPGGIVDEQIQSNSSFRICLKVQDVSDSREMIKRPDAAKITQAGRAFVRVGEDEYFDAFQSYWSGAPYFGSTLSANDVGNQVRFVSTSGQRIKTVADGKTRFKSDVDELNAVVGYIADIAAENGIQKLAGPWLPELPEYLSLYKVLDERFDGSSWPQAGDCFKAVIGMFDSPKTQRQGAAVIDFSETGHLAVYGSPSTGKTSLLKTLIMSLCESFSPEDVHIYAIDCGGWGLNAFSGMPHVGGVALDCEEEKIFKLEKLITEEADRRRKIFYANSVSSIEAYRRSVGKDIPALFLIVDNISAMFNLYPALENTFINISSSGAAYGIYLVYTSNNMTGVRYKVIQNIKGAVAFELNDKGDYAGIVGKLDGMSLPKITGRGFIKGTPPLEFQAAMYADFKNEKDRTEYIRERSAEMSSAWSGKTAPAIPFMPERVAADDIIGSYQTQTMIPVGMNYDNIRVMTIDMSENYCMAITGDSACGKSAYLARLTEMQMDRFAGSKVYVFDSARKSLRSLKKRALRYARSYDDKAVTAMLAEIVDTLNRRKREQNAAGLTLDMSVTVSRFDYKETVIVIDDLKDFVDNVSDSNRDSMERICRLAHRLGVMVFAAGRISDLSVYNEIESLTRAIIGNGNGISLSNTPAACSFFPNNMKYSEKSVALEDGDAYVFTNGKCFKVKLFE